MSRKKRTAMRSPWYVLGLLVGVHPVLDLGLGQTLDVLTGMAGCLTTAEVQEVQSAGSLVQGLLIASGIAEVTMSGLLDQGSGLGVVLLLADDLLHGMNLLSFNRLQHEYYTNLCLEIKSLSRKIQTFC